MRGIVIAVMWTLPVMAYGQQAVKDKPGADFVTATRGPVTERAIERGMVEAVDPSEVICRVGRPVTTISWVIDEGSRVKKGDKVLELDPSQHADRLRKHKEVVGRAETERKRAADAFERVKNESRIDIKLAEVDLRLAQAALQQYKGNDAGQKDALSLQVDRAALLLERVKLQAVPRLEQAAEVVQLKQESLERAQKLQRTLEQDIANCVMTAPRDGVVTHFIPERFQASQQPLIAQGEPVREGQKLLVISDLKRQAVEVHVHEASIAKVRAGQGVKVRVDAFPDRVFEGKVSSISAVASHADYLARAVKVYKVMVTLEGDTKGLRPGMSVEAAITMAEQPKCLRLPTSAVFGRGKSSYCWVLAGTTLELRKISVGASESKLVEIVAGLKEDELVLRDPDALVRRLTWSIEAAPARK